MLSEAAASRRAKAGRISSLRQRSLSPQRRRKLLRHLLPQQLSRNLRRYRLRRNPRKRRLPLRLHSHRLMRYALPS